MSEKADGMKTATTDLRRLAGLHEVIRAANGDWHDATALWSVQADIDWLLDGFERYASALERIAVGCEASEWANDAENKWDACMDPDYIEGEPTVRCSGCEAHFALLGQP